MLSKFEARIVKDCRGKDTIRVDITGKVNDNIFNVFSISPNGTSRGIKEVRDFSIRGIKFSVDFANKFGKEIIKFVTKKEIEEKSYIEILEEIEEKIRNYDISEDFRIVGGNTVYAIEAALIKAIAKVKGVEVWELIKEKGKILLPMPVGNCIGGGKHVEIEKKPEFQEFLVIPKTKRFFEAYFIMQQAYKKAEELLKQRGKFSGKLTIENAMVPLLSNEEVLSLLLDVKDFVNENFNAKIEIGVDIAATSFFKDNVYIYKEKKLPAIKQLEFIEELIEKYSLFYVEDPFNENDFESFSKLLKKIKEKRTDSLIVGDDLTCTNPKYIEEAIKKEAINGIIIKPNQVGSLIKTLEAIKLAKKNGLKCIISHRSGESVDDFIADLSVGWQIPFIKTGVKGDERESKLRRLIKIEKQIINL